MRVMKYLTVTLLSGGALLATALAHADTTSASTCQVTKKMMVCAGCSTGSSGRAMTKSDILDGQLMPIGTGASSLSNPDTFDAATQTSIYHKNATMQMQDVCMDSTEGNPNQAMGTAGKLGFQKVVTTTNKSTTNADGSVTVTPVTTVTWVDSKGNPITDPMSGAQAPTGTDSSSGASASTGAGTENISTSGTAMAHGATMGSATNVAAVTKAETNMGYQKVVIQSTTGGPPTVVWEAIASQNGTSNNTGGQP